MAAILYCAILNSDILDLAILLKILIPTNSIWLKVIHSDSSWWWQPYWILPSWIQPFCTKENFTHCILTQVWWWQPYWILPSWIQTSVHKKDLLSFILTQKHWWHSISDFWLKLQFSHLGLKLSLNHSHFTMMMAAILNSAILNLAILDKTQTPS